MANNANTTVIPVTISSGQTVSTAAHVDAGLTPVAIITPAALTGTTMTVSASIDDVTYYPVYDITGAAYSIPVGTSRYIALPPGDLSGARHIKLTSGSSEGADRSIGVVVRQVA